MRERWFGATGRKVPEIALEGTVDLEGRSSSTTSPISRRSTPRITRNAGRRSCVDRR
jgi:hypothetical protein